MKFARLAAALALTASATAASADDLYALFPKNCVIGNGGEGNAEIGNGEFSFGETNYTRVGPKRDAGNGFFVADYDITAEGEPYGVEPVRMRLTPQRLDLVFADGQKAALTRCR